MCRFPALKIHIKGVKTSARKLLEKSAVSLTLIKGVKTSARKLLEKSDVSMPIRYTLRA